MRIEVLSYDEHTRWRKAESAFKHDNQKYAYERWSQVRKALLGRLSTHRTIDSTEFGDGDCFVGEDWFETGVLHVVVIMWKVLTIDFLQECHKFLVPPYDDFLITVGKSMPAVDDMFQLVVTTQRAYIRFFKTEAEGAGAAINAHARYRVIRALLT